MQLAQQITAMPLFLHALNKASRPRAIGKENEIRDVPRIDLSDFEHRKAEIADALWAAAMEAGAFQLCNHGIEPAALAEVLAASERFFALPEEMKARHALRQGGRAGWERTAVGAEGARECLLITHAQMDGLWPGEQELPGFRTTMLAFEAQCWTLCMRLLSCFAAKLGLAREFFVRAHDPLSPGYQSTLSLLRGVPLRDSAQLWRRGAHADFHCLTLWFQGGASDCGNETDGNAPEQPILCLVGDTLAHWRDVHRGEAPGSPFANAGRDSVAFFCLPNLEAGEGYARVEEGAWQDTDTCFVRY